MSWEIWGKRPLRLRLLRGPAGAALHEATYVVFVVVRAQVLVMGRGPQPDPGPRLFRSRFRNVKRPAILTACPLRTCDSILLPKHARSEKEALAPVRTDLPSV